MNYTQVLSIVVGVCLFLGGCQSDNGRRSAPAGSNVEVSAAEQPVKITAIKAGKAPRPRAGRPTAASESHAEEADIQTSGPVLRVSGRVTTPQGEPAANVTVGLRGMNPKQMVLTRKFEPEKLGESVTNARGEYNVRGALADVFYLTLSGDAPEMQVQFDQADLAAARNARGSGLTLKKDIQLLASHRLAGQVVDESGKPMAGLPVRMVPDFKPGDKRMMKATETTTTAAGDFTVEDMAEGSWTIGASHPDYAMVAETVKVPTTGPVRLRFSARGGTVTGRVINKATGAPAAGVGVILGSAAPNYLMMAMMSSLDRPVTTSTADGSFRFDHVGPGKKSIMVMPASPVKLGLAAPKPADISLEEQQTTDVTVFVYPGHTISGRVFDKDTGEPLPGARVKAAGMSNVAEVAADANGNYKLEHVFSNGGAGNSTSIGAESDGYTLADAGPGVAVQSVSLPNDEMEINKDLPMVKKLTVRGVVVTAGGKPIPHARVALYNNRSYSREADKKGVDKEGRFELETLPFVTNVVEAEAAGYGETISDEIEVAASDVEGIKIVMEPGATIEGRVLGPEGEPISGAQVSRNKDYGTFSTYAEAAVSGEGGVYRITDAPKKVTLRAKMDGYATSDNLDLSLAAGETRPGADLHLQEGFVISGRVIDASRKPVAGQSIQAQTPSNSGYVMLTDQTDEDGKFEIKNLPDGVYQLRLYGKASKTVDDVKAGTKDLEIVVGEPDKQEGTNRLIGTVVDDVTSKPIEKFEIEDYQDRITRLREPGTFQMMGIADRTVYNLTISSEGYETQKFQTKSGSGGETIRQEFRLGTGGAITGRVVEKGTKKPMPGLTVVNWGSAQYYERSRVSPRSHTITDEKGTFLLAPALSGDNFVEVKASAPYSNFVKTAKGVSGQTTDMGDIELIQGGTITGQVIKAADEQPVAGQRVSLSGWSGDSQVSKETTADAEGRFNFDTLPPMNYTVSAGSVSKSVVVEAEGTSEVILKLGSVTVKGTVSRGGVPVRASVSASGPGGQSVSDYAEAGAYEIKNVIPGTYKFQIYPQGGAGDSSRQIEETVEVPDQAEFTRDFQLPDGRIEVTVIDAAGQPVAGASVSLTQKSSNAGFDQRWLARTAGQQRTDAAGKAKFEGLQAGVFGVNARKEALGTAIKPDVQVSEGQPAQVQLQLSTEGGTLVSVALSYATGQGLQEAWCYLHGENGPFTHSAMRGADGVMTITNIPPGTYTTNVSYWSHSQSERQVEIKANETARIEDVLYPAGAIHWTLKKADGSAASGATVTVTPISTDPPETQPRTGRTGSDGKFVQRGLAGGTYQATAQLAGKPAVTETFTVAAGQNVEKGTTAPGW